MIGGFGAGGGTAASFETGDGTTVVSAVGGVTEAGGADVVAEDWGAGGVVEACGVGGFVTV